MAGADNSLTYDDCSDDCDEGFEQGDCLNGSPQEDVNFTPLEKIRQVNALHNRRICDRQNLAALVQEFFRSSPAECVEHDLPEVMKVLEKFTEESIVRAEILHQIPNIATCAVECATRVEALKNVVSDYLLPIVLRNLSSSEKIINMTAHRALISLIEEGYIDRAQTEIKVCPAVLALSNSDISLDVHTGCIMLMSRLAPMLGRDVTERVFLSRFCDMCGSHMFYLRKICAMYIGDLAAVVSKNAFEKYLLPRFLELCIDEIWGVRKSCAECMVFISCASSMETRRKILAPIFLTLLRDVCRWVKISAFQVLGAFITTFADPPLTRLGYTEARELVLECWNGTEFVQVPAYKINSPYETQFMLPRIKNELEQMVHESEGPPLNLPVAEKLQFDIERARKAAVTFTKLENDSQKPAVELLLEDFRKNVKESSEAMENVFDTHRRGLEESKAAAQIPKADPDLPAAVQVIAGPALANNRSENGENNIEDDLSMFNSYNYWYIRPNLVEVYLGDGPERQEDGGGDTPETLGISDEVSDEESKVWYDIKPFNEDAQDSCDLEGKCQITAGEQAPCDPSCSILDKSNESNTETESDKNSTLDELLLLERLTEDIEAKSDNVVNGNNDLSSKDLVNTNPVDNEIVNKPEPPKPRLTQDIVPQELIDHFISMTNLNITPEIDNEILYHCAFALPAVVLTLGSKNWFLLKDTVEALAAHLDYKVRRTVACSLHELALILGPQITTDCLVPLLDGFLKDLDEVRIGVLKNLAHFLKLVTPEKRAMFLPKLRHFLVTDNEWNWRFRAELAKQLIESVPLYSCIDACKFTSVTAQMLMCDKVATVREMALHLVCEVLRHIQKEPILVSNALVILAEKFAHSKKWRMRQTYALLCKELLEQDVIEAEVFAGDVLPHLLDLSWDPIANVRVVVAGVLTTHIFTNEYFCNPENEHLNSLEVVLRRLQADKDRDVRDCATFEKA